MSFTRKTLAAAIDEYDEQIELLNDGKRDTFVDYRAQLAEAGMDKEQISEEIAAFKKALRKRRARKEDPIKVDREDDLVDEILAEIEGASRVAHARVENIEEISTNRTSEPLAPKGGDEGFSPPASGGDDEAGLVSEDRKAEPASRNAPAGSASDEIPATAPLGVSSQTKPEARMPRASSPPVSTKKIPIPGPENNGVGRQSGEFKHRDMPDFLRRTGSKAEAAVSG